MRKQIFVLGESGVGKTTLMKQLCLAYPGKFFIPAITTTRAPRLSDASGDVNCISLVQYEYALNEGRFLLHMQEDDPDSEVYYGYLRSHVSGEDGIPLLYGSPYAIDAIRRLQGVVVLIEADSLIGLRIRGDVLSLREERIAVNERLRERFYSESSFRNKMDILFTNDFEVSIEGLTTVLFEEISKIVRV